MAPNALYHTNALPTYYPQRGARPSFSWSRCGALVQTGAKRCGADTEAETRSARQAAAEGAAPKTYTGSHPQLVAKLKRSLGAQYEPFRALAVRYQHGALPVEQFVADAAEMTGGRAAPLLAAAARALPDAARRTALLQALCA